jgi:hypothetical protein
MLISTKLDKKRSRHTVNVSIDERQAAGIVLRNGWVGFLDDGLANGAHFHVNIGLYALTDEPEVTVTRKTKERKEFAQLWQFAVGQGGGRQRNEVECFTKLDGIFHDVVARAPLKV